MNLNNTEWAYMAGMIDGDGCIQAASRKDGDCQYRVEIHVIQKDLRIIDFLYGHFEGSVGVVSRKHTSGIKHYFRWMISGPRVIEILKGCLPYLVLKKEQAELGIKLQSIILPRGKRIKLSQEIIEQRNEYGKRIKLLNSPATTECVGSLTKEMRQSELEQMKNLQRVARSSTPLSSCN